MAARDHHRELDFEPWVLPHLRHQYPFITEEAAKSSAQPGRIPALAPQTFNVWPALTLVLCVTFGVPFAAWLVASILAALP